MFRRQCFHRLVWRVVILFMVSAEINAETVDLEAPPITIYGHRRNRLEQINEFYSVPLDTESDSISLDRLVRTNPSVIPKDAGGEGDVSSFLIRGQDAAQSRYFLEGIPLTDAEYNASPVSLLPLESLGKIEFYPQGTPVSLGGDGLGGAMNMELVSPEKVGIFSGTLRGGSFGYARAYAASALGSPGFLGIEFLRSNEDFFYVDNNGTDFNADDDVVRQRTHNGLKKFFAVGALDLINREKLKVKALALGAHRRIEIPGAVQVPSQGVLRQTNFLGAIKASVTLDAVTSIDGLLFLRTEKDDISNPNTFGRLVPVDTKSMNWGARFNGNHRWKQIKISSIVGLEHESFDRKLTASIVTEPAKERWHFPLGLTASFEGDQWNVTPAVLLNVYAYQLKGAINPENVLEMGSPERQFFLPSPRVGASLSLSRETTLRTAFGHYSRAPTMMDLFGIPGGITPAPSLKPENAYKADFGVESGWRRRDSFLREGHLYAFYFASLGKDLITHVSNGQQALVALNVGQAFIQGAEGSAELKTRANVVARTSLLWLSTTNLSEISYARGKSLPGRPPYRLTASLGYEVPSWDVAYTVSLNGPSYWDLINEKKSAAISEHTISLNWRPRNWGNLGLEIRNIFDAVTADVQFSGVSSFDNTTGINGFPAPGRRFFLTWRWDMT